jgi:hypothetical protein
MQRVLVFLGALCAAVAICVAPANAIKFGVPDGTAHPYVGLAVVYNNGFPLTYCSGSLVGATTFLTAAHCIGKDALGTVPDDHVEIWFSAGPVLADRDYVSALQASGGAPVSCNASPLFDGYPCVGEAHGTSIPDPGWTGLHTLPNTHDVGLVLLDQPRGGPYASVAPVGYLDRLVNKLGQQDVEFTVVGYGFQSVRPFLSTRRERMVGTVTLVTMNSSATDGWNFRYSNNPGAGHGGSGGICFGDSGGPVLRGDIVVGISSFTANDNCAGSAYAYRTDTQLVHDFIADPT